MSHDIFLSLQQVYESYEVSQDAASLHFPRFWTGTTWRPRCGRRWWVCRRTWRAVGCGWAATRRAPTSRSCSPRAPSTGPCSQRPSSSRRYSQTRVGIQEARLSCKSILWPKASDWTLNLVSICSSSMSKLAILVQACHLSIKLNHVQYDRQNHFVNFCLCERPVTYQSPVVHATCMHLVSSCLGESCSC